MLNTIEQVYDDNHAVVVYESSDIANNEVHSGIMAYGKIV